MSGEKMKQNAWRPVVEEIMTEFAGLTGLSPAAKAPRRYLWTDAFAVCNFLELYRQTGNEIFEHLALKLVEQVHSILGRHRVDDSRRGWISGLDEQEGKMHPTRGGLRIGKEMNERKAADPFDEHLEWDRDGQYYHYLTKWMHALDRVSRVTGDSIYNRWAIELAKTAHAGFTYIPSSGGQKRMFWKMAIDLSYPLVTSMGHHDPLDGFITYNQLLATAAKISTNATWPNLDMETADMAHICEGIRWATDDPLGIGGLLSDAFTVAQLIVEDRLKKIGLLEDILEDSLLGLESYLGNDPMRLPADYRLAFRELGLSIGLQAVERLWELMKENPAIFMKQRTLALRIEALRPYVPLAETVETFWTETRNRKTKTWPEHREINMVMLATSLAPDGFLLL
jgi:hypothetical protein